VPGERARSIPRSAFEWLPLIPRFRDVIRARGDPLIMSTALVQLFAPFEHPRSRDTLATRVPVTLPARITPELVRALRRFPGVGDDDFNHPRSHLARASVARLVDAGLSVMNQTVLLRGINDDKATSRRSSRARALAVRPYTLQADPVRGTGHLRTARTGFDDGGAARSASGIALQKSSWKPWMESAHPANSSCTVRRGRVLRTFRGVESSTSPPG